MITEFSRIVCSKCALRHPLCSAECFIQEFILVQNIHTVRNDFLTEISKLDSKFNKALESHMDELCDIDDVLRGTYNTRFVLKYIRENKLSITLAEKFRARILSVNKN